MSPGSARTRWFLIAAGAAAMLTACSAGSDGSRTPADTSASAIASPSAAPVGGAAFERFTIGDLAAVALRDGALNFPNDNAIFGVGRTPAEVAALLEAAGAPGDSLHLSLQPLLVKTSDRVMLFDTGAGTNFGPTAGHLASSLAAADVDPESVTDIFISHAHGDHVGGLVNAQGTLVFPNAVVHMSAPAWAFLKGMDAKSAGNAGVGRHAELVEAITPKVVAFAPGSTVIPGVVKAVDEEGHSPGHSGYLITSGKESLLYIGDALHHYVVSVQRPGWPNSFDSDTASAAASRRTLLERSAASGQRIYAVHLPFPGIGRIEKRGEGFVWVPE